MALTEPDAPLTPDWWLLRLGNRLQARRKNLDLWWKYYTGEHPLPEGPRRRNEVYRDFQKKSRTNFMETVVDASVFRLLAIGIADGQGRSDDEAWRWWQANKLDARQRQVYRTALNQSEALVLVGRHPADNSQPLITAEHPREAITEDDPETRERRAALKAWHDDVEGVNRANVYLPDRVVKYDTKRASGGGMSWSEGAWTIRDEVEHDLGAVPMVSFPCRPDLGEDPLPEFGKVIDIQDRVNLGVLNRMTAERYAAFRQKWVKGHKFKRTRDPETGLETIEQPFVPDPGSVWATESETGQFGEFSQTDLMGYLKSHETDIRDLLVISKTPAYLYAGDLVNIATDTIAALDAMHLAKVGEHQSLFGEGWEEMLGLAAKVAGVERDFTAAEIRWADARRLNPAVMADAAVKKQAIGYPLGVLAEDLGESPQRINRILADRAGDALLNQALGGAGAAAGEPAAGGA